MYLGVDLGTSLLKLVVLDDAGELIAQESEALNTMRPQPRWSEQHPHDWWVATDNAITRLRKNMGRRWSSIHAIGLSGQMHGAVLLSKQDQVLRPAILWNDTRSDAECRQLTAKVSDLHSVAGNMAMPGFTAPKLLWIARHEPEIFRQTACVLLPKDYLRLCISGEKVSDMSDAAGTLWLDVARRDWSDMLLEACHLDRSKVPRLVEGNAPAAQLRHEVAIRWGLSPGTLIAGGGGDNAASAIGVGAVERGDTLISLGTSGVIFAVNDRFRPNPYSAVHTFCHALPDRWHQMSVMLTAASALRWLCIQIKEDETALLSRVEKLTMAQRASAPLFLPYLSGERTPHNDPLATGQFCGITHATDAPLLAYSVLEGVAFGLADGLLVMQEAGSHLCQASLLGGGARSHTWAQLIADTLNIIITTHHGGEVGAAKGAARLAWLATGGTLRDVCHKPTIKQVFTPDIHAWAQLQNRLKQYRLLYKQQIELRTLCLSDVDLQAVGK